MSDVIPSNPFKRGVPEGSDSGTDSYVTIMRGVNVFLVVVEVWSQHDQEYKISQHSKTIRDWDVAEKMAREWAEQKGLEVR